jgi:hypothetical protein
VQEQREVQQVRLLDFVEELRVTLVPLRLRLPQRVKVLDGDERVLVDREPVRIVPDDELIDYAELRHEHGQQAKRMHDAQRFGRVRRKQNLL